MRQASEVQDHERVRHVDRLSGDTRAVTGLASGDAVKAATYLRVVSV